MFSGLNASLPSRPAARAATSVTVVGGGVSAMVAALTLKRLGVSVALVGAAVPHGTSASWLGDRDPRTVPLWGPHVALLRLLGVLDTRKEALGRNLTRPDAVTIRGGDGRLILSSEATGLLSSGHGRPQLALAPRQLLLSALRDCVCQEGIGVENGFVAVDHSWQGPPGNPVSQIPPVRFAIRDLPSSLAAGKGGGGGGGASSFFPAPATYNEYARQSQLAPRTHIIERRDVESNATRGIVSDLIVVANDDGEDGTVMLSPPVVSSAASSASSPTRWQTTTSAINWPSHLCKLDGYTVSSCLPFFNGEPFASAVERHCRRQLPSFLAEGGGQGSRASRLTQGPAENRFMGRTTLLGCVTDLAAAHAMTSRIAHGSVHATGYRPSHPAYESGGMDVGTLHCWIGPGARMDAVRLADGRWTWRCTMLSQRPHLDGGGERGHAMMRGVLSSAFDMGSTVANLATPSSTSDLTAFAVRTLDLYFQ